MGDFHESREWETPDSVRTPESGLLTFIDISPATGVTSSGKLGLDKFLAGQGPWNFDTTRRRTFLTQQF